MIDRVCFTAMLVLGGYGTVGIGVYAAHVIPGPERWLFAAGTAAMSALVPVLIDRVLTERL